MTITLLIIGIIAAVVLSYKTGKWITSWEITSLRAENTQLIGEVYGLIEELERRPSSNFINDIKELEGIPWE